MKRCVTSLTVVALVSTAPAAAAQPQVGSLNHPQTCSNLNQQEEPIIIFGQETSRGRYLGNIYSHGRTSIILPSAKKQLPLRPSPEVALEGSPISPLTIPALISMAEVKGFWKLPSSSTASSLDAKGFFRPNNKNFITIDLPCRKHTVSFTVGTEPKQFAELYSLLKDLLHEEVDPQKTSI